MDTTLSALQRSNFSLNFDCNSYPSFTALELLQASIWGLQAKNCSLSLQRCPSHPIPSLTPVPNLSPSLQSSEEIPKSAVLSGTNTRGGSQGAFSNQYKQAEPSLVLQLNQWPKKALTEPPGPWICTLG